MPRPFSSLVVRIFAIVALAVAAPASLLFTAALAIFEKAVAESVDAELRTSLDGAERDLTSFLADISAVSGALADDAEVLRAFGPGLSDYERTKALDRAVDGLFMALPGRDAIRWTFLTADGIYTSWPRNFNDYGFLRDSPIARRARELGGHVAWEGFNPSFVVEERAWSILVSTARLFPADPTAATTGGDGRIGTLIISAETEAFRKYLRDRRVSDRFATLLIARDGETIVDAANRPLPSGVAKMTAAAISAAGDAREPRARIGDYRMVGRRLSALPSELAAQDWSIAVLYSYGELSSRFDRMSSFFILGSACLFAAALVVSYFVSRRVVRPIVTLSRTMESWRPSADGSACKPPDTLTEGPKSDDARRPDEIGVLHRSFARLQTDIVDLLGRLGREHEIRELYRYRSLRAQLNPHFLFNGLNSVRWLALIRKADNIVKAIDDLSGLLVYSMGKGGDASTLRDELASVENYLAIQNLRYGGRFRLARAVPEELLDAEALRFMLQPLVENCVVHGYKGASGEGVVEITASASDGILATTVADRGAGPDPASIERSLSEGEGEDRETGLGLRNVRDMLVLTYGSRASLELLAREGGGAVVAIRMPLRMVVSP
jgi:two-component system, sensor histidine kinase YesM